MSLRAAPAGNGRFGRLHPASPDDSPPMSTQYASQTRSAPRCRCRAIRTSSSMTISPTCRPPAARPPAAAVEAPGSRRCRSESDHVRSAGSRPRAKGAARSERSPRRGPRRARLHRCAPRRRHPRRRAGGSRPRATFACAPARPQPAPLRRRESRAPTHAASTAQPPAPAMRCPATRRRARLFLSHPRASSTYSTPSLSEGWPPKANGPRTPGRAALLSSPVPGHHGVARYSCR